MAPPVPCSVIPLTGLPLPCSPLHLPPSPLGTAPKGAPHTQLCTRGNLAKAVSLLASTLLWRMTHVLTYGLCFIPFQCHTVLHRMSRSENIPLSGWGTLMWPPMFRYDKQSLPAGFLHPSGSPSSSLTLSHIPPPTAMKLLEVHISLPKGKPEKAEEGSEAWWTSPPARSSQVSPSSLPQSPIHSHSKH